MAGITSVQGIELPSFRMKRSHKKSRSGCVSCKRRRVKCDETQPRCNRCTHRGLECVYGEQQPGRAPNSASPTDRRTHSNGTGASPSTDNDSPVTSPAVASSLEAIGVTQTELAHNFLTNTALGFAATSIREEQAEIWRSLIPSLAYTSTPVRHGMLVLSALSLHCEGSTLEPSSKYLDAAEAYGDMFVKECGVQLKNLEPAKIDAAVACSRILSACALAFFRIRRSNGLTLADSEAWTWLQLLRGVQTIHISIFEAGYQVHDLMVRDLKPELPDSTGAYSERPTGSWVNGYCYHPLFNAIQSGRQERFAALRACVRQNACEDNEADVFLTTIDRLEHVTNHICEGEMHSLFRAIVTWPGSFPQRYADILVNDLHPLALAIYAHWLVLVIMVEDLWWVGDMGRSGICEIVATCSDTSDEISQLLQWPGEVIQHLQDNAI